MPSLTQRVLMGLMPGRAQAMERESREWFVTCAKCSFEQSIWDLGGIRYGARSKGSRVGVRCAQCGRRSMQRLEHRPPA
ncbi:MAG: hypothetical protein QOG77_898 [Solirubrobacteraceae bacterium]|jgi:hypothetical protein|nr:hypothetical protein [Solirubrobacteraceae bacterium]